MIQARTSDTLLNMESVLARVSELDIFKYYCSPFRNLNEKFCSELRKDDNPSCVITESNGKLCYRDYGSTAKQEDCIGYIQKKYGLTFMEALKVIDADFGLGLQAGNIGMEIKKVQIAMSIGPEIITPRKPTVIQIKSRKWNSADDSFWMQFGITRRLLTIFEVQPIEYFWIDHSRYKCEPLAYAYNFNGRYKIYQPLANKDIKWFSNTLRNDIQGYKQLDPFGDLVMLTSSLKDVMTLEVMGYQAVAMQSEMHRPPAKFVEHLQKRFKKVAVFLDNDHHKEDNPGQTMANIICSEFNLFNIVIPPALIAKDVSDLVRDHGLECAKGIIKIQLP